MTSQRIAVIGGVASGTAAAAEARRTDPDADIVLFEKGAFISYGACEIPLYLGGEVSDAGKLVGFTPDRFSRERGAEVRTKCRVDRIEPLKGELFFTRLEDGESGSERFDKFILATGAEARVPDVPGVKAENVFVVRELADAIALDSFRVSRPIHHAVIAGGGYVGLEVAEALTRHGIRVSIVQPAPGPLHRQLGTRLSGRVVELLASNDVSVRQDRFSGLVEAPNGTVQAVRTESGERIGCQLVVLAMGIVPNTRLGTEAGIRIGDHGGYRVNDGMRTNLTNVWACGDCVEVERVIDGRPVLSPLSLTAYRTGRVAGRNAARRGKSAPARFPGVVGAQGVRLFDREVAYVGMTEDGARESGLPAASVGIRHRTRAALARGSEEIEMTLVFERSRGRILGAQMFGGSGTALRADVLIPMVRAGSTVDDLYDQDLIYAPAFSPRLDPLLVAAKKAIDFLKENRRR